MRIITRAEWGALRQARLVPVTWRDGDPLVYHHTATTAPAVSAPERQESGIVRGIDRHHYYVNGWRGGVGYGYLIAPSGRIYEGRGRAHGAHAPGANHLPSVALIGDHSSAGVTPHQRGALAWLYRQLRRGALRPHSAYVATACPGDGARRALRAFKPGRVAPPAPPLPHGATLRLAVRGHPGSPWAGWAECIGPLRWIAAHGLAPEPPGAGRHWIAWRGGEWYGARDVTAVARNLVARAERGDLT